MKTLNTTYENSERNSKPGLSISFDQFPAELHDILKQVDDEGNGFLEIDELTQIFSAYKQLKQQERESVLSISAMPKQFQEICQTFDTNGNGKVEPAELSQAAKLFAASRETVKRQAKAIFALCAVLALTLACMASLTFLVVELSKETKVSGDGMLTATGSKDPVKVKSADTSIDDSSAQLLSNGGKEVTMPKRSTEIGLNFDLPLEFYRRLEMVRVDEPDFSSLAVMTGVSKTASQLIIATNLFKIRVFRDGNTLVEPLDDDLSGPDMNPLLPDASFDDPTVRHLLSTGRALLSTGGVNVKLSDEVEKENEVAEGAEANFIKVKTNWKCKGSNTRILLQGGEPITNWEMCKARVISNEETTWHKDNNPRPCSTQPALFGFKSDGPVLWMDTSSDQSGIKGSECWCLIRGEQCEGYTTYAWDRVAKKNEGEAGYAMFYIDQPLLNRQVTAVTEATEQLGATDNTPIPDDPRIKLVATGAMCMNVKKLFPETLVSKNTPIMQQKEILEDVDSYPFMTVDECMQLALKDPDCMAHGPTNQFHDYGRYDPLLGSQSMGKKPMKQYHCTCSYQCEYDSISFERAENHQAKEGDPANVVFGIWNWKQGRRGNPRCNGIVMGINRDDRIDPPPSQPNTWRYPMPVLASDLKLRKSYDTIHDMYHAVAMEYPVYENPRFQASNPITYYKADPLCKEDCEMKSTGTPHIPVATGHCLDPRFRYSWTEYDYEKSPRATTNIYTWNTGSEQSSCSVINIGNTVTPENKFEVPPGQKCPLVINEENGVDSSDAGLVLHLPTFTEEQDDGSIKHFLSVFVAKGYRGRGQTAWEQNIQVQCCTPDPASFATDASINDDHLIVTVGIHPAGGYKRVTIPHGLVCPSRVNKNNWLGPYDNDNEFIVTHEGGREDPHIKISRPHHPGSCPQGAGSWTDQYLQIKCAEGEVYEPKPEPDPCTYVEIGPANSRSRPVLGDTATWEGAVKVLYNDEAAAVRNTHCYTGEIIFTHNEWKVSKDKHSLERTPTDDNDPESRDNGQWKEHKFRMKKAANYGTDSYEVERIDALALEEPYNRGSEPMQDVSHRLWNYRFRAPCCPDGDMVGGSIEIQLGNGDGWTQGTKRVGVPDGYMCDHTVSRDNWVGGALIGDTFHVTQEGNQITRVVRTDMEASWGMHLTIRCYKNPRCMNVVIGTALTGGDQYGMSPSVTVPQDYICPDLVNKNNWYGGWDSDDEYLVSRDGDQLSVARMGCNVGTSQTFGWELDLQFQCCMLPLYEDTDRFGCPSSMTVTVPTSAPALCSHRAANPTITYYGEPCGNGKILWTSMETKDASGNQVFADNGDKCAWSAHGKDAAWRNLYTGSCGVAPAVAGVTGLPTVCSEFDSLF